MSRSPGCLTGNTIVVVHEVTMRELRKQGARVLERVMSGEALTVTRDGHPVAEIRPLPRPPVSAALLLSRWRLLPVVDAARPRADVDAVLEPSL